MFFAKPHNILSFRYRKIDFGYLKWSRMLPGRKKNIDIFSIKIHIKPICSSKTTMLTLFEHLKHIKTDRKSIVVSGSLDITSGSRLKWPFVPKQGPRCLILDWVLVKPI